MLFHVLVQAAAGTDNPELRRQLDELADLTWYHLLHHPDDRRPIDLRLLGDGRTPNWHNVLRIVDGLTQAATVTDSGTRLSTTALGFVHQLLAEADDPRAQVVNSSAMRPATLSTVEAQLSRAGKLADQQPARAAALLYQTLATLDTLIDADEAGDEQAGPTQPMLAVRVASSHT